MRAREDFITFFVLPKSNTTTTNLFFFQIAEIAIIKEKKKQHEKERKVEEYQLAIMVISNLTFNSIHFLSHPFDGDARICNLMQRN